MIGPRGVYWNRFRGRPMSLTRQGGGGGTPTPTPTPTPAAVGIPIGVNLALGGNTYYGYQHPFLDRFKTAADGNGFIWGARNTGGGINDNLVPVDSNGWPTGLASGSAYSQVYVGLDRSTSGQPTTYRLTYTGVKPSIGPATITSDTPGQLLFTFTRTGDGPDDGGLGLTTTGATSNIKIVRTDQAALLDGGAIFNPAFVTISAPWKSLRMLDWNATNASEQTTWASRPLVTDASWAGAVPIEIQIAICNEIGADLWYCLPHAADDTFVTNAATLILDTLNPELLVRFQLGNELWNSNGAAFNPAFTYMNDLWVAEFGADGAAAFKGAGYRAAQVAEITNTVFAAERERLINVLGTQTISTTISDYAEDGIEAADVGAIDALFDSLAITMYFGNSTSGFNSTDRTTIKGWVAGGSGGKNSAFQQIEHGGLLTDTGSDFDYIIGTVIPAQIAWASARGLAVEEYEGGWHDTSFDFDVGDQPSVSAWKAELAEDARMATLYARRATELIDLGVQSINTLSDIGKHSVSGQWSIQPSPYAAPAVRYAALKALALATPAPPTLTLSGTPVSAMAGDSAVFTPTLVGGLEPYSDLTLASGALPAGRSISGKRISGTYTTAGSYTYTVQRTDRLGAIATLTKTEVVAAAPAILFASDFTGTADTKINTLSGWTTVGSDAVSPILDGSGYAYHPTTGTGSDQTTFSTGTDPRGGLFRMTFIPATAQFVMSCVLGLVDSNNRLFLVGYRTGSDQRMQIRMTRLVAGSFTYETAVSNDIIQAPAAGYLTDWRMLVTIAADGSTMTITPEHTTHDGSYTPVVFNTSTSTFGQNFGFINNAPGEDNLAAGFKAKLMEFRK